MAFGPIYVGSTSPVWRVTVKLSDNTALILTGATFAGVLADITTSANTLTLTVGGYSITDATNGVFTYSPVAGDVAVAGSWWFQTIITISGRLYTVVPSRPLVILPKRS